MLDNISVQYNASNNCNMKGGKVCFEQYLFYSCTKLHV